MKRFAVIVAMVAVLALAAPVFAGPFSDVPASHWAYDALDELAQNGVLTGYPDGTFKGKNTLSRYEIAVIIARLMDNVEEQQAMMAKEMDALEGGLTAGQAEDTIAIFKSLIRSYMPELPEGLTDEQASEIVDIVEALTLEFAFEIDDLGADVEGILERLATTDEDIAAIEAVQADLEARIADLEVITWSGAYDVTLDKTVLSGGTAYLDPFVKDANDDDAVDADDKFAASDVFEHTIELGMAVQTPELDIALDLAVGSDDFAAFTNGSFDLAELNAVVTGDDFEAVIGRDQEHVLTSYLFGLNYDDDGVLYNGAKLTIGEDEYVLYRNAGDLQFATQRDLGIFDSTLYFGMEDVVDSSDMIVGVNTPLTVAGLELATEVAVQKNAAAWDKYFDVTATKVFGPVTVEGNYVLRDAGFVGIQASGISPAGYGVDADATFMDGNLNVNGYFKDYGTRKLGMGADFVMGNLTADFEMKDYDNGIVTTDGREANVEYTQGLAFADLTAGFNHLQYTDTIGGYYVDDDGVALDQLNRAYAELAADLPMPGFTATGSYVFGINASDVDGAGLTTHEYAVAYDNGGMITGGANVDLVGGMDLDANVNVAYSIFEAGIDMGLVGTTYTELYANVDPEAYTIFDVAVDTKAGFEYADGDVNYNFAADLTKQLSDRAAFTYGYVYDNREFVGAAAVDAGLKTESTASLTYDISSTLNAEVNYTALSFDAANAVNSYMAKSLTTGLSLEF